MKPVDYFKALSDNTRIRMLNLLLRHELNVYEITTILEMGQSRISRHLKILTDTGLLKQRRDGLWVFYSAVNNGDGRKFIDSIQYLLKNNGDHKDDLDRTGRVIEDRVTETRNFFNSIASDWDNIKQDLLGNFDLQTEIIKRVRKCKIAADLGCGTGDFLQYLKAKANRVIGVDNSPKMLDVARKRFSTDGKKIDLRLGEMEHLPLGDGEADFAMINMVLHHLPQPLVGIKEAYRILKKSDNFFLIDFDKHTDETLRTGYNDRWLGFDEKEIASWMATAGFRIEKTERFNIKNNLTICIYRSIKE